MIEMLAGGIQAVLGIAMLAVIVLLPIALLVIIVALLRMLVGRD